jgi:tetratricopeptide (TPR) repeat protein
MTPQEPNESTHPELFRHYTNGRALQSQGQHDKALQAFTSCLKSTDIFGVMQYQDIMMCIAFCYADLLQFEQAIETYERLEQVLSFEGEWYKALGKLKLIVPSSYPTSNQATMVKAKLYDSMGIAYDNLDKHDEAKSAFGKAIRHYRQLDALGDIANTFNMMSMRYQQRKDWEGLKKLAEYILQVADKFDGEGKNSMAIRFTGWRMMAQASTNLQDLKTSVIYQEKVVDFMRKTQNPQLANFVKILEATKRALGQ